ncbi:MAG: metallophosphoesterase family protein [Ardenticatenaceae bacterium]
MLLLVIIILVLVQVSHTKATEVATTDRVPATDQLPTRRVSNKTRAVSLIGGTSCETFSETGYTVCDDSEARFLSAFEGYGLQNVGYPISRRFQRDGFMTQAFQKAILQWQADSKSVAFVNIFDELHDRDFDETLFQVRQTPNQLPAGWDGDLSFEQVVRKRQALLSRPALRKTYFAASDPLTFFGLPTSEVEDMGNHYAIRLQRAVLQEWKEKVPWAEAGQVTIANGGDIAKELGHLPKTALILDSSTATADPTAVPTASTIRFAAIGDFGKGDQREKRVADMVKGWQPEFIITMGDNNYPDGEASTIDNNVGKYYSQYIYPYDGRYTPGTPPNRFFPSLGNHDWNTTNAQPYLDYFPISSSAANTGSSGNERYYDFVQGPVHFFAIDSDQHEPDGRKSTSKQAAWLKSQLAASRSPWQIVYFHHAAYSSASRHGSDSQMEWPFAEWGADAVIAGHDHTYERLLIENIPYFVNGLGGATPRDFGAPIPGSQARYKDDNGAMLVEANESSITFQFYSVANGGTLIDRTTIWADN